MKTTTEQVGGGPQTLEAFADKHGLTLEVTERSRDFWMEDSRARYFATFADVWIDNGYSVTGMHGNGPTAEAAVSDYAQSIRGARLVLHPFDVKAAQRFSAPNEWLPSVASDR